LHDYFEAIPVGYLPIKTLIEGFGAYHGEDPFVQASFILSVFSRDKEGALAFLGSGDGRALTITTSSGEVLDIENPQNQSLHVRYFDIIQYHPMVEYYDDSRIQGVPPSSLLEVSICCALNYRPSITALTALQEESLLVIAEVLHGQSEPLLRKVVVPLLEHYVAMGVVAKVIGPISIEIEHTVYITAVHAQPGSINPIPTLEAPGPKYVRI